MAKQIPIKTKFQIISSMEDYAQISSSENNATIISNGENACISVSATRPTIISNGENACISVSGSGTTIISTGKDAVICCSGSGTIVKAKIGSLITLTEWKYSEQKKRCIPICVKTEQVDGIKVKENTFYGLINGEFKEFKDEWIQQQKSKRERILQNCKRSNNNG